MKTPAEILVLGGTHGNEPFGIELVNSLRADPLPNVEAIIANERAAAIGERRIHTNLNCEARPGDGSYEGQRIPELIGQCARFGLILDFHNAVNQDRQELYLPYATKETRAPARWLLARSGIRHVLTFSDDTDFYKALPPAIILELGMPDMDYSQWEDSQLTRWRKIIGDMAKVGLSNLDAPLAPATRFMELVSEPSRAEAEAADLDNLRELQPYDPLPKEAQNGLGLPDGKEYRVLSSNYQNMSAINPSTGKRTYWGSIAQDIDPFL